MIRTKPFFFHKRNYRPHLFIIFFCESQNRTLKLTILQSISIPRRLHCPFIQNTNVTVFLFKLNRIHMSCQPPTDTHTAQSTGLLPLFVENTVTSTEAVLPLPVARSSPAQYLKNIAVLSRKCCRPSRTYALYIYICIRMQLQPMSTCSFIFSSASF